MAYAFNEDKGKVDIDAILNGLQTNYQNNVNTIYNAIVNAGITPTAKTPAACSTGIGNIINTIYNAIVAVGVTPTAKTTSACTTGINTLINNIYNAIVNNHITPTAKTSAACVAGINNIRKTTNLTMTEDVYVSSYQSKMFVSRPYTGTCAVKLVEASFYVASAYVGSTPITQGQTINLPSSGEDIQLTINTKTSSSMSTAEAKFQLTWG